MHHAKAEFSGLGMVDRQFHKAAEALKLGGVFLRQRLQAAAATRQQHHRRSHPRPAALRLRCPIREAGQPCEECAGIPAILRSEQLLQDLIEVPAFRDAVQKAAHFRVVRRAKGEVRGPARFPRPHFRDFFH